MQSTKLAMNNVKSYEMENLNESVKQPHSSSSVPVIRSSVICENKVKLVKHDGSEVGKEKKDLLLIKPEAKEPHSQTSKPSGSHHKISECPICSEVCVNHLHYGGICCYSCKAFFRRSVTAPSRKIKR